MAEFSLLWTSLRYILQGHATFLLLQLLYNMYLEIDDNMYLEIDAIMYLEIDATTDISTGFSPPLLS